MKTITIAEFDTMRDKVTGYYKLCPDCPTCSICQLTTTTHVSLMPTATEPCRVTWECRGSKPLNIPSLDLLTLEFCQEVTGWKKTKTFTLFGKDPSSILVITAEGQKTITTEDLLK